MSPVAIVWPCPATLKNPPWPPGSASPPPRPSTAAPSPSSAPAAPPTSRPASTPCYSKPSPHSPASSAGPDPPQPGSPASRRHRHLPEREHRMLPTHVQTSWPLTGEWSAAGPDYIKRRRIHNNRSLPGKDELCSDLYVNLCSDEHHLGRACSIWAERARTKRSDIRLSSFVPANADCCSCWSNSRKASEARKVIIAAALPSAGLPAAGAESPSDCGTACLFRCHSSAFMWSRGIRQEMHYRARGKACRSCGRHTVRRRMRR